MMINLTIKVDSGLLENIDRYAKSKGKTVSELLEVQLRKLVSVQSDAKPAAPVSSRLRGVVRLPENFDYKQELENRSL